MSSPSHGPKATLRAWCDVAQRVGGTRKRLEKRAALVAYWATLHDADLPLGASFFAGQVFAAWDERVLAVGQALLLRVFSEVTGTDDAQLRQRLVQLGDMGDLACAAWPDTAPSLTLAETFDGLARVASLRQAAAKHAAVLALLTRASAVEARFIVGLMLGDLRIGLKESLVEESLAAAYEVAPRTVQWANMLRGDIGATAMMARQGTLEEARMALFHPLKPMLASPAENVAAVAKQMPQGFALEDKYDGIRAQIHISAQEAPDAVRGHVEASGVRIAIFSRTHSDMTHTFPDLQLALATMLHASGTDRLLLDGEILAVQDGKILPFNALQTRLGRRKPTKEVLDATPVAFVAFDLLCWGDDVLLEAPYSVRRTYLEKLKVDGQHMRVTPSTVMHGIDDVEIAFTQARARGNEGLVVKALDASYTPGRRGREWLKIKRPQATLDVVITSAEVGHGKRRTVLSDYTFAVRTSATDATLLEIGKAYSGLTDAEIVSLTELLRQHTLDVTHHGKKHVVEPAVVLEIAFDLVQASQRYASGYALRFPRIVRLRPDKRVADIDVLETVAALCLP